MAERCGAAGMMGPDIYKGNSGSLGNHSNFLKRSCPKMAKVSGTLIVPLGLLFTRM